MNIEPDKAEPEQEVQDPHSPDPELEAEPECVPVDATELMAVQAAAVVPASESTRVGLGVMCVATLLFIVLALLYNAFTPFLSPEVLRARDGGMTNPDEHEHFRYVLTVAYLHRLPVFADSGNTEGHQPPLYYLACAAFYPKGSEVEHGGHVIRCVSTACGVGMLWLLFLALRQLWPDSAVRCALVASTGALIPMNVGLCAAVNNDSLTNASFAAGLYVMALIVRGAGCDGQKLALWRSATLLGVVIGASIYVKMSGAMLFFATAALWVGLGGAGVLAWRDCRRGALLSLGMGLVIALPWLWHNWRVSGDLLGTGAFVRVLGEHNFTPHQMIEQFGLPWYVKAMGWWTFESYWGVFDSMSLRLPNIVYLALAIVCLGALGGLPKWCKRVGSDRAIVAFGAACVALVVVDLLAFIQYNVHFFQAQGRYFLPSALPLTLGLVGGLTAWFSERRATVVAGCVLAGAIVLNIVSIAVIATYFRAALSAA